MNDTRTAPSRPARTRPAFRCRSPGRTAHCAGILLALVLAPATYATTRSAPDVSPWSDYPTVAVESGQWHAHRQAWGRVRPWREATLTAPFPLAIASVAVVHGEAIDQGQPLATVASPDLDHLIASLAGADQRLRLAERHVGNMQRLFAERLAPGDERVLAEMTLNDAQGRLGRAWQAVSDALLALGQETDQAALMAQLRHAAPAEVARAYSVVKAPFSARVAHSDLAPGVRVARGGPLFQLEDTTRVYVDVEVPPADQDAWRQGSASIVLPAGQHRALQRASRMPTLDTRTGLVVLRFLADNPAGPLLAGDWVAAQLESAPQPVLWVPAAAVAGRDGKSFCIVRREGHYQAVEVRAAPAEDGRVPVLAGLQPSDRVVTQGAYELLYRDLGTLMTPSD